MAPAPVQPWECRSLYTPFTKALKVGREPPTPAPNDFSEAWCFGLPHISRNIKKGRVTVSSEESRDIRDIHMFINMRDPYVAPVRHGPGMSFRQEMPEFEMPEFLSCREGRLRVQSLHRNGS